MKISNFEEKRPKQTKQATLRKTFEGVGHSLGKKRRVKREEKTKNISNLEHTNFIRV